MVGMAARIRRVGDGEQDRASFPPSLPTPLSVALSPSSSATAPRAPWPPRSIPTSDLTVLTPSRRRRPASIAVVRVLSGHLQSTVLAGLAPIPASSPSCRSRSSYVLTDGVPLPDHVSLLLNLAGPPLATSSPLVATSVLYNGPATPHAPQRPAAVDVTDRRNLGFPVAVGMSALLTSPWIFLPVISSVLPQYADCPPPIPASPRLNSPSRPFINDHTSTH